MAEKKMERKSVLDPAVADLLAGLEQRQADSQLPRKVRERKARERAKMEARRELRATYDLPVEVRRAVADLAEAQRVPASQIVTLALLRFFADYRAGRADPGIYKRPSRSPRYDWNLEFPEEMFSVVKVQNKKKLIR